MFSESVWAFEHRLATPHEAGAAMVTMLAHMIITKGLAGSPVAQLEHSVLPMFCLCFTSISTNISDFHRLNRLMD